MIHWTSTIKQDIMKINSVQRLILTWGTTCKPQ